MIKKLISSILVLLVTISALSTGAAAASSSSSDDDDTGFSDPGGYTETTNEYFFDVNRSVLVYNKETSGNPEYDKVYAGSDIYIPLYVYVNRGGSSEIVTDKMVKEDNVSFSAKVLQGSDYVGEMTLVDTKKLKLDGLPAGMYVHIPIKNDYTSSGKGTIVMRMLLSVNNVSYPFTQIRFKCYIVNPVTKIKKNSVYGAKVPTQFESYADYTGEATFDFGDNIKYTAKVKKNAKYYLHLSREADKAITKMYPDTHLEFYNFIGDKDTFNSTGKLEIPIDRDKFRQKDGTETLYVYRVNGDSLTALGAGTVDFNTNNNKLTINTKKLDYYLLSSQALSKDIDHSGENILRSGYAAASESETSEISASSNASSTAAGGGAQSGAASADGDLYSGSAYGEDGYVPEEGAQNDNLSMGLPINVNNNGADNPNTADAPPTLAAPFAGLFFGALVMLCYKKKTTK